MDRATFAYRLHFENEPAEELAKDLASRMPGGLDRIFLFAALCLLGCAGLLALLRRMTRRAAQ